MPYVPTEEEKARQKEYADKKAIKDKSKNDGFNNLTVSQQDAIRHIWKAYKDWDTETDEMGGDMYYSTFQNLKKVHGLFYQSFPLVTQTSEEEFSP